MSTTLAAPSADPAPRPRTRNAAIARRIGVVLAATALASLLVFLAAIALVASYWHARHVFDDFTDPSPIAQAPDMVPWLPLTTDGLLFAAVGVIYWRRIVRKDIPPLVWGTFGVACAGTIGANAVAAQVSLGGYVAALWPVVTMIGVDLLLAYVMPGIVATWGEPLPPRDPAREPSPADTTAPVSTTPAPVPAPVQDAPAREDQPAPVREDPVDAPAEVAAAAPEPTHIEHVYPGDGTATTVPVTLTGATRRDVAAPAATPPVPALRSVQDVPAAPTPPRADRAPVTRPARATRAADPDDDTGPGEAVSLAALRGATVSALRTPPPSTVTAAPPAPTPPATGTARPSGREGVWTPDDEAKRVMLQAEVDAGGRWPTPSSMRTRWGMNDKRAKRIIEELVRPQATEPVQAGARDAAR